MEEGQKNESHFQMIGLNIMVTFSIGSDIYGLPGEGIRIVIWCATRRKTISNLL